MAQAPQAVSLDRVKECVAAAHQEIAGIQLPDDGPARGRSRDLISHRMHGFALGNRAATHYPLVQDAIVQHIHKPLSLIPPGGLPNSPPQIVTENSISVMDFFERARTGDLILFAAEGDPISRSIGILSTCPYAHVGMVMRGTFERNGKTYGNPHEGGMSMWHAKGPGEVYEWKDETVQKAIGVVTTTPLNGYVIKDAANSEEGAQRIVWAPLQVDGPQRDIVEQKIKEFASQTCQAPFIGGAHARKVGFSLEDVYSAVTLNTQVKHDEYSCGSIIAATLAHAELLPPSETRSFLSYVAGSFSHYSRDQWLYTSGKLALSEPIWGEEQWINPEDVPDPVLEYEHMPYLLHCHHHFGRAYRDVDIRLDDCSMWGNQGRLEYISAASMTKFALELIQMGAPPQYIAECYRFADDEVRHARICSLLSRMASEKSGDQESTAVNEYNLLIPTHELEIAANVDVSTWIKETVDTGCIGEAISACVSYCQFKYFEGTDLIQEKLLSIAEDEVQHSLLSWKVIVWCLGRFEHELGELKNFMWWKSVFDKHCEEGKMSYDMVSGKSLNAIRLVCWNKFISKQIEFVLNGAFDEERFTIELTGVWQFL